MLYSALPAFGNSADIAGAAQNVSMKVIEASIDFMAVRSYSRIIHNVISALGH